MKEKLLGPREYTKKYIEVYRKAQALFAQHNPCQSQGDGTCIRTRTNPAYTKIPQDRCCSNCKFHDRTSGCKTIALSCKLWVCGAFYSWTTVSPETFGFMQELRTLQTEAHDLYPQPRTRESLDETLYRLKDMWKEEIEQWAQENSTQLERKSASQGA